MNFKVYLSFAFMTLVTIMFLAYMVNALGDQLALVESSSSPSPSVTPIETLELEYKVQSVQNGDLILVSPHDRADNRLIKLEQVFAHSLDVKAGDTVFLYVDKYDTQNIIAMEGLAE